MASSPVTAPSPDSSSPPAPPTSPTPLSPQLQSSQSPPPEAPLPASPPPQQSSPPPSSPPPSSFPPPPSPVSQPPPPPPTSNKTPPSSSPPPPNNSGSSSSSSPPVLNFNAPPPPKSSTRPPPKSSPSSSQQSLSPPPPKSSHGSSHANGASTENPSPDNGSSSDLNLPLVIGVVAGVGLLLVLMIILVVCCTKKKKKQQPHGGMHYYDASGHNKAGGYYNSGAPHNWQHNGRGMDHVVKLPPPPGAVVPPGGGWHPPPPPPLMNSADMSSAYSGPHGPALPPPSPNIALGFNKSTFTYEELAAATGGFSQANLLGQGGFGYVHKGVLPNGKEIAVKQLKSGSGQGEREFQAEVDIISRVHHRHLVSLVGYCIAGTQRMLVYEFVSNKTLEYHLHGKGLPVMNWPTRLRIAIGSAKGLAYLHEDCHPRIIHRDIKTANILLDNKFEAMVADFGLAKLSSDNHTHVSTRVMGTFGYLAPEYASSGKLTEKSDVFSFGVMLLELITGRRPVDNTHQFMEDSLVDWARPILTRSLGDDNFDELADPRLENNYNTLEMARLVACAAAAVRHSARKRPKMSQIVRALEGDVSLDDLSEGVKPGQSMAFSSGSDYDSGSYASNMTRFRKMALASGNFSDEYSGPTSEYGLNPSSSSSEGYSDDMNHARIPRPKPRP